MNASEINFKNLWKPSLVAAAVAFLYANVLTKLGFDWWTDENYSHGLLVPFVIGFIIWSEFDLLKKAVEKSRVLLGFAVVLLALVFLLGGVLGAELFVQRISLILMLAGIVIYFFGSKILQLLVVPFALLLFAIPIPQIIFNKIAFPLQIYASQIAVWGIRLFAVPTVRKGNVFEILPQGATQTIALEVVEACSGIRSLMTLVTLALILAYFTRDKKHNADDGWFFCLKSFDLWRTIILMLSAIPIAVLTNAGRVTAIGVLTYNYGKKATESFWHDLSGWLVYLVALGLLIGFNALLKFISRKAAGKQSQKTENSLKKTNHLSLITYPSSLILVSVLLIGGVFINWFEHRGEAEVSRKPLAEMSEKLGDWRQKGDEIRFSEQTESVLKVSDYTMREYTSPDDRLANVYIGYYASQRTGATYHSPQNCLPGAGWIMKEPETVEIKTPGGKTFRANRYRIENGIYNEIMIYWYQGRGHFEASEYQDKINTVWDSIFQRRSDGAMIRIMTSVGSDEQKATEAAIELSARTADAVSDFVPE
jgi:exosortase D (VPLPA-CTERM-specific)